MTSVPSEGTEQQGKKNEEEEGSLSYPIRYFVYGSLSNPLRMQHVLDLAEKPQPHRADIRGYYAKTWETFLALVPGTKRDSVLGCAYLIDSAEQEKKLAQYMTEAYKTAVTRIFPLDMADFPYGDGKVFVYAGDPAELRDMDDGSEDFPQH